MALFPDMPLPSPGAPLPGLNGDRGSLLAGGTSGVMAGLDASLISLLRNYRPGDIGVCELADNLQLSLPVDEWATWDHSFGDITMASIGAGSSTIVPLTTVPADERWTLGFARVQRDSGDNQCLDLLITCPAGYYTGDPDIVLHRVASGPTEILWPDPLAVGTIQFGIPQPAGGLRLEPGTIIKFKPDGNGVSASVFTYTIMCRRTKIIRALAP